MQSLPPELLCIICEYAELPTILSLAKVSRGYHAFVCHLPELWSRRIAMAFPLHTGLQVAIAEAEARSVASGTYYEGVHYLRLLSGLLSEGNGSTLRDCSTYYVTTDRPRPRNSLSELVATLEKASNGSGHACHATKPNTSSQSAAMATTWQAMLAGLSAIGRVTGWLGKPAAQRAFLVFGLKGSGKRSLCHRLFLSDCQHPIGEGGAPAPRVGHPVTSPKTPLGEELNAAFTSLSHMTLDVVDLGGVHPSFLIGRQRRQACKGLVFVADGPRCSRALIEALAECCRPTLFPRNIPLLILLRYKPSSGAEDQPSIPVYTPEQFLFDLLTTQAATGCFGWDPLRDRRSTSATPSKVALDNIQCSDFKHIWADRVEHFKDIFAHNASASFLPQWAIDMDVPAYVSILFGERRWQVRSDIGGGAEDGLAWLLSNVT